MPRSLVTALAVGGVLVAGCSSQDEPLVAPSLQVSGAPTAAAAGPSPSPSASPSAEPRSPEALAEQVEFTSVATTTPVQKAAVESYRQFLEAYVVAQGIPDPRYPPLLARTSGRYEKDVVPTLQRAVDDKSYSLGPYREQVLEVGKGPQTVLLLVCSDIGARRVYDQTTDTPQPLPTSGFEPRIKIAVTMTVVADGYEVNGVTIPEESTC